jgi:SulP family sulfate permease
VGRHRRDDVLAGLTGAVAGVPNGMANAVLAGVNPIHGLYASFVGPIAGGLTASTQLMVITATSSASLAAGSALRSVDRADRADAVFLLTLLVGVTVGVAGLLKLGRWTRFVSHSVMLGFLTGIAVNIVAGQVPNLTGVDAHGPVALAKLSDVVTNPTRIEPASLVTGLAALALLALTARVRGLAGVGPLLAVVVPTVVVVATGADVAAVGDIPGSLPLPALPDLDVLSPTLITGALSVAAIVVVLGAGVREAAPNPDGPPSDIDRDLVAQGVGNLAAGLWQGIPVGGSLSATALNRSAGARTRWAAIAIGGWVMVILVAFSGLVEQVVMPTLAAVLIYAGLRAIRPGEVAIVWRTGPIAQVALATTFLATLLLPVTAAVGIGVALSLLLQLNQEAMDLAVVELVPGDGGAWKERPAPAELPGHRVTVLDVYGSLLYAGARTLEARLPAVGDAVRPVVVLRLRGRTMLGATFFLVAADYARQLGAAGGRLYLSGLDPALARRIRSSGRAPLQGPVKLYTATETLGASTLAADRDAEAWLITHEG